MAAHEFLFHEWNGSAAEFHAMQLPFERAIWKCCVTSPALILGSSQLMSDIDREKAHAMGLDVVQRRSGGGAVFVHPSQSIWIDITIPRDDQLWVEDISQSMLWVGEVFVRSLSPWVKSEIYTGPFENGRAGRRVCFSSRSPGEVFVGQKKLVGISQRRTRDGARFQCVVYAHWNTSQWLPALVDTTGTLHHIVNEIAVATVMASAHDLALALHQELLALS